MSSRPIRALGLSLALLAAAAATPDPAVSQQLDLVLPAAPDTASPVETASPGVQLENLRQAEEAHRRGDFARAKELWGAVVQANPYRPGAWLELAESRAMTGDMGGGLRALNRSLEMGLPVPRARVFYGVAQAMARGGQPGMAVDWLRRALEAGFGDRAMLASTEVFSGLRGTPAFDSLLAEAPPEEDRVAGWRRDVEFLVAEARRMHASPDRPAEGEEFQRLADSLMRAIPEADDDAMAVGLGMLAAALGDGHTWVAPLTGDPDSPARLRAGLLPVRFYAFRDGIYVVDGKGDAAKWIGRRVDAIGGRPTGEVLRELAPFVSRDNAMGMRGTGVALYLRHTGVLRAVGAVDSLEATTLTLADESGSRDVTLEAGMHRFDRALPVPSESEADPPRWLADPGANYWMERVPGEEVLYAQINSIRDADTGPDLAAFAGAVRDALESQGMGGIVVDLRWNGGGNNGLIRPLVRHLVAWENSVPDRRIVVLAGRHTFSAAQNLANRLERWTDAVFVGEPTGSRPNAAGERTDLVLPWSRLTASISNRYWQDSDPGDERPWIPPHVRVEPSASDYFSGRDPVLEAAVAIVSDGPRGADARRR